MSMRKAFAWAVVGALPLMAACGGGESKKEGAPAEAPKAAAPAASTAGTASITGKIAFDGTVPPAEKIKVSADAKCQTLHPQGLERQSVLVKDGGLANVFVYVKSGISGTYPAPTEPVVLDQHGCNYSPHVLVLQAGQPLKIRNSDDTLHNIHPRPKDNEEFNMAQPRQGMESTKTFTKPEVMIPVGCEVHPWMRAFISVFDHPFFAVSKEDGTFEIKGLPAGEYEIEAIHEKLKSQTQKITVKDGEAAKQDFTFKG